MSIDWSKLETYTKSYASVRVTADPENEIVDVVATGLRVKLSDLVKHFPASGGATLSVYADTLVVDEPSFDARGVAVAARNVELARRPAAPLTVELPQRDTAAVSMLVGGVTGGELQLEAAGGQGGVFTVPAGRRPLQVAYYFLSQDGKVSTNVTSDRADVVDMIGRAWPLSALKASFTAATWLMNSTSAENLTTAQSMLSWVVDAIGVMRKGGASVPGDVAELHDQAAALLVTLNTGSSVHYVPVLSTEFYRAQVDELISALKSYEDGIAALRTAQDVRKAIDDVSATLGDIATDEVTPLQTELGNVETNLADLGAAVRSLNQQFDLQAIDVETKFSLMINKMIQQQVKDWFAACIKMAISVVKIGASIATMGAGAAPAAAAGGAADVGGGALGELSDSEDDDDGGDGGDGKGGGGPSPKDIAGTAIEAFELVGTAISAIEAVAKDPEQGQRPLLNRAKELVEVQQKLMANFLASIQVDVPGAKDAALGEFAVDPVLAWENYVAEVTVALDNKGSVAADYKTSLLILTNYGKAINTKIATYAGQRARASVVRAQIAAAQQARTRWEELAAKAVSDQERLDALVGVLQTRADAIKRTTFTAWTRYRAAYYYLYFQSPPVTIDLDMNAAQLGDAFARVSTWIGKLLGDDPSGGKIELPNDDVTVSFEFDVARPTAELSTVNTAYLTPASGTRPATLTWAIPMGTDQLKGVLPHGGNVAVWITEAKFFVDGIEPNEKGKLLASVATSGTYENGYGPGATHAFDTKRMVGDYGYDVADQSIYNPWRVEPSVYMTPTPFTQWTMTFDPDGGDPTSASRLRMELTVAYRGQP